MKRTGPWPPRTRRWRPGWRATRSWTSQRCQTASARAPTPRRPNLRDVHHRRRQRRRWPRYRQAATSWKSPVGHPQSPVHQLSDKPTIARTTRLRTAIPPIVLIVYRYCLQNTILRDSTQPGLGTVKGERSVFCEFSLSWWGVLHGVRGVGRGELVAAVHLGALRGGDGAVEEGIFCLVHPGLEARAHVLEHVCEGGIAGEVVFVRVVEEVVELFGGDGTLGPAVERITSLEGPSSMLARTGWGVRRRSGGCTSSGGPGSSGS